jgi:hypothetical protein
VNYDSTFTEDDYQGMLDDHAVEFNRALEPLNSPTLTRFGVGVGNIDTAAVVYLSGSRTILTETTQYTMDYQRGILTTPAINYQPLSCRGTAYNLYMAAADAWERIASRYVLEFDFSDVEGSYSRSQQSKMCQEQAAKYRRMAGATSTYVERGDQGSKLINIDRVATG